MHALLLYMGSENLTKSPFMWFIQHTITTAYSTTAGYLLVHQKHQQLVFDYLHILSDFLNFLNLLQIFLSMQYAANPNSCSSS